jgi:hypothetical protein
MEKEYRMSYVLGGLFYHESLEIYSVFKSCDQDWERTKKTIKDENLLNANRRSSLNRVYREVEIRLKNLTENELKILESGSRAEKKQILWLSCCKTYRLMCEIAVELLYTKAMKRERSFSTKEY